MPILISQNNPKEDRNCLNLGRYLVTKRFRLRNQVYNGACKWNKEKNERLLISLTQKKNTFLVLVSRSGIMILSIS